MADSAIWIKGYGLGAIDTGGPVWNVLTVTATNPIVVSWPAVTEGPPAGYEIEIDGGAPIRLGRVTSYTHTAGVNGQTYSFRVRPFNADGEFGAWSMAESATVPSYNDATGGTITTFMEGGKRYRLHTFSGGGTFTVLQSNATFDVIGVGGGGSGRYNPPAGGGGGGRGERWQEQFPVGDYPIVVGGGSPASQGGGEGYGGNPSSAFGHTFAGGNGPPNGGDGSGGWGQTIDFEGTGPQGYGHNGGNTAYTVYGKYGGGGGGGAGSGNWGFGGGGGVVQIRYEIAV